MISVISPQRISPEGATQIIKSIKKSAKLLRADAKPVLVEVCITPLESAGTKTRKAFLEAGKNLDFDFMAIVASNSSQVRTANLIITAARYTIKNNKADRVKLFKSKPSAERWLRVMDRQTKP
jgi:hypothetical protein